MGRLVPADDLPGSLVPDGDLPEEVAPVRPPGPRESVIGEEAPGFLRGVARGGWSLPGLVGLDYETATGAEMAVRDPMKLGERGMGLRDRFGFYREQERERTRRGEAENPIKTGLGIGVGSAPSMAVMPQAKVAEGAGLGARAMASGLTAGAQSAAIEGGVTGDLPTGERLKRMGAAGATGLALGPLAPVPSTSPVPAPPGPASEALREYSIKQGRKVLTGNSGAISVKKALPDEVVAEALQQGAIRPLGTTQKAAEVLGNARETAGQGYADIIAALEAKGVTGPNAVLLAQKLATEADQVASQTLGSPKPGVFRGVAEELTGKVPATPFASKRLGLTQAENMKRALQDEAASEYDKLLNKMRPTGEAKVAVASRMREAIEDAVSAQASKAPEEAAAFEPAKAQLSRIIAGSNAANEASARMSRNRGISLSDTVAGAAGAASGGFTGAAGLALMNKLGRSRGPATLSWVADKLSKALRANPQQFGAHAPALLGAAERGPEALAAAHYVLSHSSPEYRLRWEKAAAEDEGGEPR